MARVYSMSSISGHGSMPFSISGVRCMCLVLITTAAATSGGGSTGPLFPVGLRTELEPSPFGVRLGSTSHGTLSHVCSRPCICS